MLTKLILVISSVYVSQNIMLYNLNSHSDEVKYVSKLGEGGAECDFK